MRKMIRRRPLRRPTQSQVSYKFNGGRRMPLDVAVDDDGFTVFADIPGLSAEEVQLQLEEDVLTLRTEPEEQSQNGSESLWRERPSRAGERRIRLPEPVDREGIDAWVENGVLTVRLPKTEEARPRKIEVQVR